MTLQCNLPELGGSWVWLFEPSLPLTNREWQESDCPRHLERYRTAPLSKFRYNVLSYLFYQFQPVALENEGYLVKAQAFYSLQTSYAIVDRPR